MISVIMPVYNAEEWIREALQSLKDQMYDNFEVIMVNDGSTDGSEEICREFSETDARFHLMTQPNAGVSIARNHGIDQTNGEWIAFMDADDVMPKEALAILMKHARESGAKIVAGTLTRGIPKKIPHQKEHTITVDSETAIMIGLYQKRILNSPCGVLYHKSVFRQEPLLRFRKCRYEDLDMFYQAFERVDRVCMTDQIVYFYRDNPESFINRWSDARLDVLDVTDRIVTHMKRRGTNLLRAALDRRFSAHFNMLIEMERNGIDNSIQKQRCLKVIREQRRNELKDTNVRFKNKLGALVSYLGMPAIRFLCKF